MYHEYVAFLRYDRDHSAALNSVRGGYIAVLESLISFAPVFMETLMEVCPARTVVERPEIFLTGHFLEHVYRDPEEYVDG